MSLITYDDKVDFVTLPLPETKKVVAANLNNIKSAVNGLTTGGQGFLAPRIFTKEFTPAEIRSANSSPVDLGISAPGANAIIEVISASFQLDFESVAYDQGTFRLRYIGGTLAIVRPTVFLTGLSDRYAVLSPAETLSAYEDMSNSGIELLLETADATVGDSPVKMSLLYKITDFSSIT